MLKRNHIASICNEKGQCKYVLKVRVVDDPELNKLQRESVFTQEQERIEKQHLYETIQDLEERIIGLEKEIKVLKGEE